MTEALSSVSDNLGLIDPGQWNEISSIEKNNVYREIKHVLQHRVTNELVMQANQNRGFLPIERITVAKKQWLIKKGGSKEFRLIVNLTEVNPGTISLYEVIKKKGNSLQGFSFGPDFTSAEDAWNYLVEIGYQAESSHNN